MVDAARAAAPRAGARAYPHARRVLISAGMIALVVTLVILLKAHSDDLKDADVWWKAGQRVLHGGPLTGIKDYRYPPTFAVFMSPLCVLPRRAFYVVWYLINVGLFALSVRLTARLLDPGSKWGDVPRFWLSTAVIAVYAVDNLFLGQTNILVMALVYLSLLALSRDREWLAGLPLAGAIAVKVFPAPLFAYFVYRLWLRAAAATVLGCLFLMLLAPAPVRGFGRNYQETRTWWNRVVAPYLSRGKAGDWGQHALDFGNQSLQAVAHRYLTPVNAYVVARDPTQVLYVNFVDMTPEAVNRVILVLFALLAGSFMAACGLRRPGDALQQATEYSLAVILVLLVSALSWTYFFVMMLLPIATAMALLARGSLRPRTAWMLKAGLVASALAAPLLMSAYARALGHVFWATMVLYVGMAVACWEGRETEGRRHSGRRRS
ncbi:MAG: glycosyltransferase family 87 protein [Armatimonadota bacterium]